MKAPDALLFCGGVFLTVIVSTSGKYERLTDILGQNNLSVSTSFDKNTLAVSENKFIYGHKHITFPLCAHL
jgi:hypothetical protein